MEMEDLVKSGIWVDFVKMSLRYGHDGAAVTRSGLLRVFGLTERLVYGPYGPRGCQYVDCRVESRVTTHFIFSHFCQLAKNTRKSLNTTF